VQIGAEILLRISWEFKKSLEWLLTGEGQSVYSRNPIWYPELYHREPKAHDFDNHESI